jgi:hypothetical protein
MISDHSFLLYVLGNGRKGYIERTIASWKENLVEEPKYKVIFDDSGDPGHRAWLNEKFGDSFDIVAISNNPVGQGNAINFIFNYIKELDCDYIIQLEEDWMLNRELSVAKIIEVLEDNPDILQMRIPRVIWYSGVTTEDMRYGSNILRYMNLPDISYELVNNEYYKMSTKNYFWSHNPSIFNKKITNEPYTSDERNFGLHLLKKYPNSNFGFWAKNPYDAYITHIGIRDNELLKYLESL